MRVRIVELLFTFPGHRSRWLCFKINLACYISILIVCEIFESAGMKLRLMTNLHPFDLLLIF
jgi:hypothetical protein